MKAPVLMEWINICNDGNAEAEMEVFRNRHRGGSYWRMSWLCSEHHLEFKMAMHVKVNEWWRAVKDFFVGVQGMAVWGARVRRIESHEKLQGVISATHDSDNIVRDIHVSIYHPCPWICLILTSNFLLTDHWIYFSHLSLYLGNNFFSSPKI